MKRLVRQIFPTLALAGTFLITACDWSSGSQENFNTSRGSANVNVSGFYQAPGGGRVVSQTSGAGNIVSLTIQQSGNRVDVTDSQGSTYSGTLGAPLVSGAASGATVQAGALLASYQVSFTGKDEVAARNVQFTGVITIVAVDDINGETSTNTDSSTSTTTTTTNSVIEPITPDDEGSGTETDTTDSNTATRTTTTTTTYTLTRSNSQLELNGSWVEEGGVVGAVSAVGPAVQGNVLVTLD